MKIDFKLIKLYYYDFNLVSDKQYISLIKSKPLIVNSENIQFQCLNLYDFISLNLDKYILDYNECFINF